MAYKVSFIFGLQSIKAFGWTENFWCNTDTFTACQTVSEQLASQLASNHGRQTISLGYRMASLDGNGFPQRLSKLREYQTVANENTAAETDAFSDYPTTALLLGGQDSFGRKSRQWMKGIPDIYVTSGGVLARGNAVVMARVNALISYLNTNATIWPQRFQNAANTPINIVSYDSVTQAFTVAAGHGIAIGDRVTVHKMKGSGGSQMNKTWTVRATTATTIIVNAPILDPVLVYDTAGSYLKRLSYVLVPVTWEALRVTGRQVGGPFGSVSGRRTNRG